jgi:glucosamine 6-phosphate synthetase-like amidotransferase/phosphosugar isomerase protein
VCGLTGILAGRLPKRRLKDIEALTDVFTMMLMLSEYRGPHATGVAWVKRDGSMQVAKEPLPARQFVQSGTYIDWLLGVNRDVTYLMGHTRWPSRGSVTNPANNHPQWLPVGDSGHALAVTHNGTLSAVQRHFARLGLPRTAQVDSELLARIAQRHAGTSGIDLDAVLGDFSQLDGRMSLALVATTRPEEIILLKGNMPLEVRIQPRTRVLVYASEARILDRALTGESGWEPLPLAHGEGLVVNTHTWTLQRVPFIFQGLDTSASTAYTGAITRKERSR